MDEDKTREVLLWFGSQALKIQHEFLSTFARTYMQEFPSDRQVISDFMARYCEAWQTEIQTEL
jgi:hypothetical protein